MTTTPDTLRNFTGDLIEPGSEEYAAASRTIFAAGSPAAVLRARTVADVQAAVLAAARSGRPLAVRGGGHGFPGFGTNDGGLVLDLAGLAEVELIDPERRLVRIGGGATWGQVVDVLAPHGLAISSGDTRSVGVGGLTLGGGIGWKVRKYGLALDALVAAEVVTADGKLVRTSADEQPDLFWALRGGGGNFGVVTAFEFAAHETTDVHFGKITFPQAEASTVLQAWADHLRSAPAELTAIAVLANPMGGPQAPLELQVAVDTDDPARAAEILDPIRRLGSVIDDDVALRPYAAVLVEGMTPPPGFQVITRNAFVDRDSVPAVLDLLAEVGTSGRSPVIAIRSLGGAVSRIAPEDTAFAHRQAELMIVITTAGPTAVVDSIQPAVEGIWDRLAPHLSGAYANFLTGATEADVAAIFPAETRRRLAGIKHRYDPDNLFAGNHNVQTSRP